jgi:signal transduction histidine kinase
MAHIATKRDPPPSRTLLQGVLHDHVLVSAFVVCALLIGYQLTVTLLQPPWIKPATDWLRTALAWPQFAVVAVVTMLLFRRRQRNAVIGCWLALGMLFYAVARTTWSIADVAIYPNGVPFPSLPDLFFVLQYPCFVAALFVFHVQLGGRWLPGVRVIVDGMLWMSAVTALSWYFVLLPLSLQTREPPMSNYISMYYQVFDLVLFYGLVMALARHQLMTTRRLSAFLLGLAVISLFVADTWAALLLVHPPYTYRTGSPPDLFWFICYLLIPLASLVRLRFPPAETPSRPPVSAMRPTWRDTLASMQFVSPSAAVVVAAVLILHATIRSTSSAVLSASTVVGIALLLLAVLRPAIVYLEQEQLRRERDAARAQESALRLTNERMEAFLRVISHELRTPLSSLVGNIEMMDRRLDTLLRHVRDGKEYTGAASALRALIERCDQSVERMTRHVENVLDYVRVRQGWLRLRLAPVDLAGLVGAVVAEQTAHNPERHIRLVVEASPLPVLADATRIEQVVTNYVGNALKFSRADRAVEVRVQTTKDRAIRVAVHDDGVGIPLADQPHIWERFYQAEGVFYEAQGVGVQSGSQVGFGLGLYISKAIVEGHHGQVGVESAPGQGTTLWFTLPLAPPLASASPPPPANSTAC